MSRNSEEKSAISGAQARGKPDFTECGNQHNKHAENKQAYFDPVPMPMPLTMPISLCASANPSKQFCIRYYTSILVGRQAIDRQVGRQVGKVH